MLDGVMLLWFILTAISVVFVAIDIRNTPESVVLKWGFILLTLYTGPFGAFLYALGCREPLPGLHERYVAVRWRQVLGSTMHCVAGDGVGILVGAVIGSVLSLALLADIALEYVLGFGFGWTIFQALFMKDTAGGSYSKALKNTFIPEDHRQNLWSLFLEDEIIVNDNIRITIGGRYDRHPLAGDHISPRGNIFYSPTKKHIISRT